MKSLPFPSERKLDLCAFRHQIIEVLVELVAYKPFWSPLDKSGNNLHIWQIRYLAVSYWITTTCVSLICNDYLRWRYPRPRKLKPRPNDRNVPTQNIATLLGATCWVRLASVLRHVATCWLLLVQIWKWSKLTQQHPTCRNTLAKRTQHVAPNNVALACCDRLAGA